MLALARIDRTRQAVARARAAGHVPRPMPAQASPLAAERSYATRLRSLVDRAITDAYAPLLRALPELLARARAERGDAATWRADASNSGRSASAAVKEAQRTMAADLRDPALRKEVVDAAGDVSDHNRVQLGRQVQAVLGINLAGDERLKPIVTGFVHENVKLITGITPKLAADIEGLVLTAITTGQLHEDLAPLVQARLGVAENRAALIAVDQVGKLNGQLNAQRNADLGITHGWWRSSEDERVRGNPLGKYPKAIPSHYARNGLYFALSDPPRGKNGQPELPGVPINCRCRFEPDLRTVLGDFSPAAAIPGNPAPDVDALEAEAMRLQREVEAMFAGTGPALRALSGAAPAPSSAPFPSTPVPLVALPPAPPSTETAAERARKKADALAEIDYSMKQWQRFSPMTFGASEPLPGMTLGRSDFYQQRDAFAKKLTEEQVRASVFYTRKGDVLLNSALREGRIDEDRDLAAMAKHLDDAIDSHRIATDTYVARAVRGEWGERFAALLQPGDVFEDPGYTSTSAASALPGKVKMRILVPEGANAAPLPSGMPEEAEFLLPRGSRFRVVSVNRTATSTNMELEMLLPGDTVRP